MKVRLPKMGGGNMGNLQQLAQQAQAMQKEMDDASSLLDEKEYSATSGGGAVKVVISGKPELKSVDINPEVVDIDDLEILSDMIVAAANEAINASRDERENTLQKISGQMNLPNIPGMF